MQAPIPLDPSDEAYPGVVAIGYSGPSNVSGGAKQRVGMSAIRRGALVAVGLGLLANAAMAARMIDPHLRHARGVVSARHIGQHRARALRPTSLGHGGTFAPPRLIFLAVPPPVAPTPWKGPSLQGWHGGALGTSIEKRARWAVLGGHGRNGAG